MKAYRIPLISDYKILTTFIFLANLILACNSYGTSYKQSLLEPKNITANLYKQLSPTLKYFDTFKTGEIDWSTSLPLLPPSHRVRLAAQSACLTERLHTYYNSEIQEELLELISKYYARKNIMCTKSDIKIRYSSFDVIRDIYTSSKFSKEDTVLIVAPTYGYYIIQSVQAGIKTHLVYAQKKHGWKITSDDLEQAILSTKAKILVFTNPVNPTGVYYSAQELKSLAQVISKHDIFVISDEIFSELYFDPSNPVVSLASMPELNNNNIITLSGLGKSQGVRLSFACGGPSYVPVMPTSGILQPIQHAAIAALDSLTSNLEYMQLTKHIFRQRVQFITNKITVMDNTLRALTKIQKVFISPYIIPKSTNMYLLSFPGLRNYKTPTGKIIKTSLDLAIYLAEIAGVVTVPGEGFFLDAEDMVLRIPMSVSLDELDEGLYRILQALKKIQY